MYKLQPLFTEDLHVGDKSSDILYNKWELSGVVKRFNFKWLTRVSLL